MRMEGMSSESCDAEVCGVAEFHNNISLRT